MRKRGRDGKIDLGEGQGDVEGGFKSCAYYGKCHVGIYYVLCYYCMYVYIYMYLYMYICTTIGK